MTSAQMTLDAKGKTTGQQTTLNLQSLLDELADLRKWNNAQRNRIEFLEGEVERLEFVLAERVQKVANKYSKLKDYFKSQRGMIVRMFLEDEDLIKHGADYETAYRKFQQKYPRSNPAFLYRRLRECVTDDKTLWQVQIHSRVSARAKQRFFCQRSYKTPVLPRRKTTSLGDPRSNLPKFQTLNN